MIKHSHEKTIGKPDGWLLWTSLTTTIWGCASYLNIKQLNENRQLVDHTHNVLSALDRIIDGVKDAERGRRGYIIVKKAIYLDTYESGIAETKKYLKKLRILTAELKKSITLWDKNQSDLGTQIDLTDEGAKLLAEIEAKIAVMNVEEQSLLNIRSDATNATATNTTIATGLGYAFSFGILVAIYFLLSRQIRLSQEIQARLETRSQMLDLANDTIIIRNFDGEISYWNQGAERLYGWTIDEVLGKNSHELLATVFPHQ